MGTDSRMSDKKKTIHPGDRVTWSSSEGTIRGTVEKKLTKATTIKGHHVAATPDRWLRTDDSREAGQREDGDRESTGHASGRHIVKMLQKKKSELTGADIAHMHKTVAFIKRHMAQRPAGDISQTRWAHSLKNWGHDPTKDD
jgi:hypothetical protein